LIVKVAGFQGIFLLYDLLSIISFNIFQKSLELNIFIFELNNQDLYFISILFQEKLIFCNICILSFSIANNSILYFSQLISKLLLTIFIEISSHLYIIFFVSQIFNKLFSNFKLFNSIFCLLVKKILLFSEFS